MNLWILPLSGGKKQSIYISWIWWKVNLHFVLIFACPSFYLSLPSELWMMNVFSCLLHRANVNVWASFLKFLNREDQFIVHQVTAGLSPYHSQMINIPLLTCLQMYSVVTLHVACAVLTTRLASLLQEIWSCQPYKYYAPWNSCP